MTEAEKRPTAAESRGLMNPNAAATRALAESASRVLQKESKIKAAGVERIALAEIHIGERLRSVDEKQVKYLADSMNVSGLLTPISVRRVYDVMIDGAGHNKVWGLIAGAHRVAASKRLGQTHIDAFITEATDLEAQLWEVDENLIRAPLNKVERDRHILRRKEIMEAMGKTAGETSPHQSLSDGRKSGPQHKKGVAAQIAEDLGVDKKTVTKAIRRAEKIAPDVGDAIAETPLGSEATMDKLAGLDHDQQRAVVAAGKDLPPKIAERIQRIALDLEPMKARSPDDAEAIDKVMAHIQENAGSGIDAAIDSAIEQCVADTTSATANRIILALDWKPSTVEAQAVMAPNHRKIPTAKPAETSAPDMFGLPASEAEPQPADSICMEPARAAVAQFLAKAEAMEPATVESTPAQPCRESFMDVFTRRAGKQSDEPHGDGYSDRQTYMDEMYDVAAKVADLCGDLDNEGDIEVAKAFGLRIDLLPLSHGQVVEAVKALKLTNKDLKQIGGKDYHTDVHGFARRPNNQFGIADIYRHRALLTRIGLWAEPTPRPVTTPSGETWAGKLTRHTEYLRTQPAAGKA